VSSKHKVTADKDSKWCCVNLSHEGQVAGVVQFSTAVCLSLRGVGLQKNRILSVCVYELHEFGNDRNSDVCILCLTFWRGTINGSTSTSIQKICSSEVRLT
jgi:hypothetical protein